MSKFLELEMFLRGGAAVSDLAVALCICRCLVPDLLRFVCAAVTGDHLVIAKETARVLGMGNRIYPATGLPVLGDGGKIPDGLVEEHGSRIIPADGFAAVFPEHKYVFERETENKRACNCW